MFNRWLDSNSPALRCVLLYGSVYTALAMAAMSVYSYTDTPAPLFVFLVSGAIGLAAAYQLRGMRGAFWIGLVTGLVMVGAAALLTPPATLRTSLDESRPTTYLITLTLCLTFTACTNDRALFVLVPALGLIVAAGTGSTDPEMTAYALVFCLASLLALLCHSSISDMSGSARPRITLRQTMLNQATLAGLSFIITAVLALMVLVPARFLGGLLRPLLSGTNLPLHGRSVRRQATRPGTATPAGAFTSGSTVEVGRGPVLPGAVPVLTIQSNQKHYLLSRVYTEYVNHGWREGFDYTPVFASRVSAGFVASPDPYAAKWPLVAQRIQALAPSDVIPVYPRLAAVRLPDSSRFFVDSHGCIRVISGSIAHVSCEAISYVAPSIDEVTDGPVTFPHPRAPTPAFASPRVQALAVRLKGKSGVETTRNIIRFLQATCSYDLNAPAVPVGSDSVDFFIFQSKAGYCDLFATSAAVLLQLEGLPARYCVGYIPGHLDAATGSNIVTTADAHAFVEVFIQGRGWITIDPTPPGFTGPPSLPVKLRGVLGAMHISGLRLNFPTIMVLLLLAGGIPMLFRSMPTRRRRRASRRLGLGENLALIDYLSMLDNLARAGLRRRSSETPYEFLRRLRECRIPEDVDRAAHGLTEGFVSVRYGRREAPYDHSLLPTLRRWLRDKESRHTLRDGARSEAGPAAK